MKLLFGLLVAGLVVLAVAMLTRPNPAVMETTVSPVPNPTNTSVMVTPDLSMPGITVIDMEGDKFRFSQDEIRVKLGEKVRINLTAIDMPHDFDLDELNVDGPIGQPGETTTIEFTASQVGEFEYYCSFGQHRANGMVGTLIVEE